MKLTMLSLVVATTTLCTTNVAGHSGPPRSFIGARGDFSTKAPPCEGESDSVAAIAPLGSCAKGRMTGFPNQCRAITGRPTATYQANTELEFPIFIQNLHFSTCGFIHLTANDDILDASKWINLTPDGAFCARVAGTRYNNNIKVAIPNVASGMYNLCYLAYAGVTAKIDSRYPDTANQHHAYHSCKEIRINNPNPANFRAQAIYPVDMGPIYIGDENQRQVPRAAFQARDGFTNNGDDLTGAKRRTFLQDKVAAEGAVSYCAQDGRLHRTARPAQACSAPVYEAPNVRPNQCNEFNKAASCANTRFGQCGGRRYAGPSCCPPAAECFKLTEFYSQCVPSDRLNGVTSSAASVASAGDSLGDSLDDSMQPAAAPSSTLVIAGVSVAGALVVVGAVVARRKRAGASTLAPQGVVVVAAGPPVATNNKRWAGAQAGP